MYLSSYCCLTIHTLLSTPYGVFFHKFYVALVYIAATYSCYAEQYMQTVYAVCRSKYMLAYISTKGMPLWYDLGYTIAADYCI